MKKISRLLIIALFIISIITSSCVVSFAVNELELVVNGVAKASIVIPQNPEKSERYAANILRERLKTITGAELPLINDSEEPSGSEINIGQTNRKQFDFGQKPKGSYFVTADNSHLYICGTGSSGTLDGVYRFLEDICGYTVYEAEVVSCPSLNSISVPVDINIAYTPFFEYRQLDTASISNAEYDRFHSINCSPVRSDEEGAYVPYLGYFAHSLSTYYCAAAQYFESHPEYFALHQDKRVPDQLCLTNDEVLEIVTNEVLALLKREHNPGADLQIVSLTQADNQHYCTCPKCAAVDAENNSHAGTMISFVNKVAAAVKQAGYNNVAIDTFAYQYTRQVPEKVRPLDNVIVRLCSIECCFGHTIDDPKCKENVKFMADLKGWSKICNRLYVWDYVNNYSETLSPFANFQVLQRNVQVFYENGVKGLYEEGNYYMNICNGEFYELRTYLLANVMKNPYRNDYDELMLNYLNAVYGPGGEYLKEFIDIITKYAVTDRKHIGIRQQPKDALPGIKNRDITRADTLWENAKAAAEDRRQLERIERSEICWQHWKCANFKKEFSIFHSLYDYMTVRKQFCQKLQDFNITYVGEGEIKKLSPQPFRVYFMSVINWESKFDDNPIYKFLDPFAERLYNYLEQR